MPPRPQARRPEPENNGVSITCYLWSPITMEIDKHLFQECF